MSRDFTLDFSVIIAEVYFHAFIGHLDFFFFFFLFKLGVVAPAFSSSTQETKGR
jgi:hypothetical protein